MDQKSNKQQNTADLPDWLQPDENGIRPGIEDISVEDAKEITRFLKEELGVDPTL